MSSNTLTNGSTNGSVNGHTNGSPNPGTRTQDELLQLNLELKNLRKEGTYAKFHGDELIGVNDFQKILQAKNMPTVFKILGKAITFQGVDMKAGASLVASMSNESNRRRGLIESQVKSKYDKMLHPPLTYLGDAFQYRSADGKYNNVMSPHLGQAGAPYAKSVPSKTHQLGALPDPGDLFDRLMARQEGGRTSQSGLSSMLIYHATIIIHDIFRTNDNDKNISDSSSYLDLSPLYGYTMEMQRKIRDDKYKLGLLKPDTFAEDRLLRQPPGVCIMLVMYNRYHNYAATQLRRINENGRFSVPRKYQGSLLEALANNFYGKQSDTEFLKKIVGDITDFHTLSAEEQNAKINQIADEVDEANFPKERAEHERLTQVLESYIEKARPVLNSSRPTEEEKKEHDAAIKAFEASRVSFEAGYQAAWDKLDDDLFNTARLITCGMYIQVAIHDYLRALMGFHQWNTNFTLDPRLDIDHHNVSRGIGNQVTVEFNLLYRFHCAISVHDEEYTKRFMQKTMGIANPDELTLETFVALMKQGAEMEKKKEKKTEPWEIEFGIPGETGTHFTRNKITGLFDDQTMINALTAAMDDPISNFGPRNVPKCLKPVEILGILQARKWEIGTLNDFRDFFNMPRHETFESVTKNIEIQNALRDLYEHPDKIELYPGVFCESDADMGLDPGPSDVDSALWSAIFSDAITLVRSDRFYTTDWNTNSLTSWGMAEVTPDNDTCKSSVFHRLLQRAFPEWYPYNSVQFFHPFYTRQTNAKFAAEQGYGHEFRMSSEPTLKDEYGKPLYDVSSSVPQKPWKPVYLADAEKISIILKDTTNYVHPAMRDEKNFPEAFRWIFKQSGSKTTSTTPALPPVVEDHDALSSYFTDLMRYIVKRESISMNNSTLQIDATRDFAIPVVTRYVADFLGFGHLIRSAKHPKAPHSENEIYQHISNCQIFLSYNADETKLLKRRKAFTKSMEFLHKLVLGGNIGEANRWSATRYFFGTPKDNAMTTLGFEVAKRVLNHESNTSKAASIMVFVGLHAAYNSVLAFTSVLNNFLEEMYDFANPHKNPNRQRGQKPNWLRVQELAFQDDVKSEQELQQLVADAERRSIKLPLVRIALENMTYGEGSAYWKVDKDHKVILDIFKANEAASKSTNPNYLSHKSTATDQFADFQPKRLAEVGITAMIKVFAQMRDVRRGHDAQGRLKKVKLNASSEGYSNYMAPMRIDRISRQVELEKTAKVQDASFDDAAKNVYTKGILKPETETYLTAQWDEMVPFPNTWKIRFDGFGKSNYATTVDGEYLPYGKLREPVLYDDAPPYYQPRGPSHTGGTFGDSVAAVHEISGERAKAVDGKHHEPLIPEILKRHLQRCPPQQR
ncbi:putative prostaglandin G/H synthase 2/cyclooxygenase 2, pgh2/cox2 [Dendryphion nanum]|uniref:Prostaglandin G/H synthase 2/cyclooxygenase 2, pgh2/cox2 n=1 Tax=Dendryphion nanum TaxID=256645 RepID=A0A9P9E709_9PLEO|nr:putative prostaglandin G/H synthase 2/cyclooxygenase 2, pgh2/cox2 [Dendryphion nanum]